MLRHDKYNVKTFKEFLTEEERKRKPWSATKAQILNHWRTLQPNQPIMPQPVPAEKAGTTYGYDGIRVTGSYQFINSVLSRFKDYLYKDSPTSRLHVILRQIEDKDDDVPDIARYVFYANIAERTPRAASRFQPKVPELPEPKIKKV